MIKKLKVVYIDRDVKDHKKIKDRMELNEDKVVLSCFENYDNHLDEIISLKPDIILVDAFSLEHDSNNSQEKLDELEILLKVYGQLRHLVMHETKQFWNSDGIAIANSLRVELDKKGRSSIPVAIASRYGRRLLDGPAVTSLAQSGNYWVWKRRDFPFGSVDANELLKRCKRILLKKMNKDFLKSCFELSDADGNQNHIMLENERTKKASDTEMKCIDEVIAMHKKKQKITKNSNLKNWLIAIQFVMILALFYMPASEMVDTVYKFIDDYFNKETIDKTLSFMDNTIITYAFFGVLIGGVYKLYNKAFKSDS
ncbi:hypothetical protein HJ032_22460 [Vibrio parahaemolyticus]|nr:hypothetical protein [Vibrio vulnificus]EIZ9932971.1 hypothetical protein [Vibrio parahaemolyticus]MBE4367961.1 hypothetical protein [Vibrio parahaemolyticus]